MYYYVCDVYQGNSPFDRRAHFYNVKEGKETVFPADVTCNWAGVVAWRERYDNIKETVFNETLIGCHISTQGNNERFYVIYSRSISGDDSKWSDPAYGIPRWNCRSFTKHPNRREILKESPKGWSIFEHHRKKTFLSRPDNKPLLRPERSGFLGFYHGQPHEP